MYRIYADNELVYDPASSDYTILDGKFTERLNTSGTLTFTLPRSNPSWGRIKVMKTIVELYDGQQLLFRGRAYAPSADLFTNDTIECEGQLAFFNDTIQPPQNSDTGSLVDLLAGIIERHNRDVEPAKRFTLGVVNVNEGGELISWGEYLTSWQVLRDYVLKNYGGYLWLRRVNDTTVLDYVKELDFVASQEITTAVNLVDAVKETSSETLATRVIPVGAKLKNSAGEQTGEYLTLEASTGDVGLTDPDAAAKYGLITKVVYHDNITDPGELLEAGRVDLAGAVNVDTSFTLKAADLSKTGQGADPFRLGTNIKVNVPSLEIATRLLVQQIDLDLLNPQTNTLTIGGVGKTLSAWALESGQQISNVENNLRQDITDTAANTLARAVQETNSSIEHSAGQLLTQMRRSYYDKEHADRLLEQVYTAIKQNADGIDFTFNHYQQNQNDINTDTQQRFSELTQYIRFADGAIILGEQSNPMTLRIDNDQIVFENAGAPIAHWSNRKFYAVDGQFLNSLQLGKFAFIPRTGGNLSFMKVQA